jgi:hypothetical protein
LRAEMSYLDRSRLRPSEISSGTADAPLSSQGS